MAAIESATFTIYLFKYIISVDSDEHGYEYVPPTLIAKSTRLLLKVCIVPLDLVVVQDTFRTILVLFIEMAALNRKVILASDSKFYNLVK